MEAVDFAVRVSSVGNGPQPGSASVVRVARTVAASADPPLGPRHVNNNGKAADRLTDAERDLQPRAATLRLPHS